MEAYTDSPQAGPSRPRRPSSESPQRGGIQTSDDLAPPPGDPPGYDEDEDHTELLQVKSKASITSMKASPRLVPHERGGSPGDPGRGAASHDQKKALWWRNVIVTGMFIGSWYGFATLLSLYNKWMFTPEYYNFPFPLFVTTCHMIVQFTMAALIRLIWPQRFRPVERPTRQDYVSKISPTAISTVGDIGLSNLSLKIITLSLYTMAKSSALLFVLLFAFLFRIETYSLRLLSVILLITFGVFLMVFNTTSVSIPGLVMVFSASALSGLRWALTELVMHKKAMGLSNPFATIFWLAPIMAVCVGVVSMGVEGWLVVLRSEHLQGAKAIQTVGVIIFPGALAFAMVASEYFIIHRAGSVPLSIAGIFKEVTTITISAWVFGDQLTELNVVGVVITVCGITVYTFHKYQKSMSTPVPLDSHGNPMDPEHGGEAHLYARQPSSEQIPLSSERTSLYSSHTYPPPETEEERTTRLRDDFEDWNRRDDDWSDADEEADDEEVAERRDQRQGKSRFARSWGSWWEKEM